MHTCASLKGGGLNLKKPSWGTHRDHDFDLLILRINSNRLNGDGRWIDNNSINKSLRKITAKPHIIACG